MWEGKYEIKIYNEPWKDIVSFVVMYREGMDTYCAQTSKLEFKKIDADNRKLVPLFELPKELADQFFKALAEALDEKDIKTDNDFKIKGLLDATKYHLEDLRKLLKLKE